MSGQTRSQLRWLGILSIGVFLVAGIAPPFPQPLEYHQFADRRIYFGIPNFVNVVSNLAFLLVGIAGLGFLFSRGSFGEVFTESRERWPYVVLFVSVALAGIGSAYYHLTPDNDRLVWDRLPIATAVMALLAATISERVSPKASLWLLPVLAVIGAGSALHWSWSEQRGVGNLNFYIVVQFYSLLVIILLVKFFPCRYTRGTDIYIALAWYGLAKLAEIADEQMYDLGHLISGHTAKHLLAAGSIYWLLRMLRKRRAEPKEMESPLHERIY
ncbi:MAG: ceramidase domain-containing protein [Nitrosospira sp.]|nr:ceramidase domain-containing protein [Nitrosospira sp.]